MKTGCFRTGRAECTRILGRYEKAIHCCQGCLLRVEEPFGIISKREPFLETGKEKRATNEAVKGVKYLRFLDHQTGK